MRQFLISVAALLGLLGAPAAFGQMARTPVGVDYGAWSPAYALAQQRAMARALEGVGPHGGPGRNVYVVSAALYGQHVFENEAVNGAAVLARHFRSDGRTIILSNNHSSGTPVYPAATLANFNAALGRIGEVMDKQKDVAVIFVTSHGVHGVGISGFEPIAGSTESIREFALGPGRLRGALDAAGIKNRIIILSACFAGQFIPTLQDPNTVVMTAASSERTSFGCRAENDWTYFGDAMFANALPKSSSLLGAFDLAKARIGAEETAEKLVPSQPQLFVGANAKAFLAEIEK